METGKLNEWITITTFSEVVTSGDVAVTWGDPEAIRASVRMVDGQRFMREGELVDKVIYKIECWDNAYTDNIKIEYEGQTLYPVRPIMRNEGASNLNELIIYASTKKS
jgi:head-tail adaptor